MICDKCGAKMVRRMARQGPNKGKYFYGCSNFPKCRNTKNISEHEQRKIAKTSKVIIDEVKYYKKDIANFYLEDFTDSEAVFESYVVPLNSLDEIYQNNEQILNKIDKSKFKVILNNKLQVDEQIQLICYLGFKILLRGSLSHKSPTLENVLRKQFDFLKYAENFQSDLSIDFLNILNLAHRCQIGLLYGLLHGVVRCDSKIYIYEAHLDYDIQKVCKYALKDLKELLNNLASLYNLPFIFSWEIVSQKNFDTVTLNLNNDNSSNSNISIEQIELNRAVFYKLIPPMRIFATNITQEKLEFFLEYIFAFPSFQEGQFETIERILQCNDTIVLLPTGAGKSIIYQLGAFLSIGITIVVAPIISLMDDQIENLLLKGCDNAIAIHSSMSGNHNNVFNLVRNSAFNLVYVSPERFQISSFRSLISEILIENYIPIIAIDEAHCVSEWGHDFRTSYLNIGRISREYCRKDNLSPTIIALTGTASTAVLKDVQRELNITAFDAVVTPVTFDRSELKFIISETTDDNKFEGLLEILDNRLPQIFNSSGDDFYGLNNEQTNAGIIFCPFVNGKYGVYNIYQKLNLTRSKIKTGLYSGLQPRDLQINSS